MILPKDPPGSVQQTQTNKRMIQLKRPSTNITLAPQNQQQMPRRAGSRVDSFDARTDFSFNDVLP
jgi:hypothetical protein